MTWITFTNNTNQACTPPAIVRVRGEAANDVVITATGRTQALLPVAPGGTLILHITTMTTAERCATRLSLR